MKKFAAIAGMLALALSSTMAHAGTDAAGLAERLTNAANTLSEIMASPDKSIPQSILAGASCVVVIPKYKKGAFVIGAQYGQGVATCRTDHGWSAPVFVQLTGGSFGWQIGGQSTDLVLVAMNEHGLQHMLKNKFKLGARCSCLCRPGGPQCAGGYGLEAECGVPDLVAQPRTLCRHRSGRHHALAEPG